VKNVCIWVFYFAALGSVTISQVPEPSEVCFDPADTAALKATTAAYSPPQHGFVMRLFHAYSAELERIS